MHSATTRIAGALFVAAFFGATAPAQDAPATAPAASRPIFSEAEIRRILQHSPLPPAPADPTNRVADDPRAVELGKRLFFDPRFSANGAVSCATCHDPAKGFADGLALGRGIADGPRHTPTLWNVAYNRWYFWDGRSDTLWAQALGPIERAVEMGFSRVDAVRLIDGDADYRTRYLALFGAPPSVADPARFPRGARPLPAADALAAILNGGESTTSDPADAAWRAMAAADRDAVNRAFSNIGKAIAAYERTLIAKDAPFDRFAAKLRAGDATGGGELSDAAMRGLELFIGRGNCRSCHSGPNFTDGEFHNVRVAPRNPGRPRDPGRYRGTTLAKTDEFNAAGAYSDDRACETSTKVNRLAESAENWGLFKTPTLRNLAHTAPYMHQGQFATVDAVVHHYSTFENATPPGHHATEITLQPLNLTEAEAADLAAFLRSLSE